MAMAQATTPAGAGLKNILITFVLAVAAGVGAFGVFYVLSDDRAMHAAAKEGDAMAWLRAEFKLSDEQFAAIRRRHEDYSVICGEHCAAIMAARERKAPAAEVAALEEICVDAMSVHFRGVAALMAPTQGDRYLAMVLPRVTGYSHHGAPNLRVTP
jgi:hypothetical protein